MSDSVASASPLPGIGMPLRLAGDDRLAALVHKGSERAFAALYQRHHAALYRYCHTIVRHEQDAQDVLQTTMVRALSALGRGVPNAPIRPWLFRIAHNEAITLLRRRRTADDVDEARTLGAAPPDVSVVQRERLATLVADLQQLPERQRGALVMRELSGLSHEEIATSLDISVGAAKQAIFDARTGLAEFQKGRVMDCAEIQRLISDGDGRMLRGRPVRAHLRSCRSCSEMRDAIGMRSADLALLAPPLPLLAASGLLAKILGAGGGHGGGVGGAGGGGMSVAAAGKAGSAVLAGKALATVAVVATVGVAAGQTISAAPADRAQAPEKLVRGAPGSAAAKPDSATATTAGEGSARDASAATAGDGHPTTASTAKAPAGSSSSSTEHARSTTPSANAADSANAHGKATSAAASARGAEQRAAHRPAPQATGARGGSRPASAGTQSTAAAAGHPAISTGAPASAPAAAAPSQSILRPTVPATPPAPPTPTAPAPPPPPTPATAAAAGAPGGAPATP